MHFFYFLENKYITNILLRGNDMTDLEFYTVSDIQNILRIKKDSAYTLIKTNGFPVLKIGKSFRIPKKDFEKWVDIHKVYNE